MCLVIEDVCLRVSDDGQTLTRVAKTVRVSKRPAASYLLLLCL
jgi:hypothetical protein